MPRFIAFCYPVFHFWGMACSLTESKQRRSESGVYVAGVQSRGTGNAAGIY